MKPLLRSFGATSALFRTGAPWHSLSPPPKLHCESGVITFLSGPLPVLGVPAKNAAECLVDALNKGGQIPGYERRGFGGRPLEVVYVDEARGPTKSSPSIATWCTARM